MADGWDILGAVGGTVGVIGGVVFGIASWRLSSRSADAADRAVVAADRSAAEAQAITLIEARRYHREIAPDGIKVAFRWRPGTPPTIHAHITNNSTRDVDIRVTHYSATGGHEVPTTRPLAAGTTVLVPLGYLGLSVPGEVEADWENQWQNYRDAPAERERLDAAFRGSPLDGGKVVIEYAIAEHCPCDLDPPSGDYGHWKTTHRINGVTF
ncbi:hypothetical protein GCM10009557_11610 [Virgisporangium ochraceum]|uniref:Uncharacterized protein n=1 Tax=Virgisporangium ochraceum TaxID=65505 RepID=A0A8J3ZSX8_9ACTN|nr:hypothetical protein [Virgisporangium ochraceum]GIJ69889.1 hypothetical protein Voc01_048060 [Virgisporangium ochraceum]